jgi:hypothetical protein
MTDQIKGNISLLNTTDVKNDYMKLKVGNRTGSAAGKSVRRRE